MLKPFEIDLLRQDLKEALKVVEQDEIDDARALITQHGFRSDDFDITQRADPSLPYPSDVTGTVTVVHKSNKAAKSYDAGSGAPWLEQIEIDLKTGVFGRPR